VTEEGYCIIGDSAIDGRLTDYMRNEDNVCNKKNVKAKAHE
jgi:hypothetical protein